MPACTHTPRDDELGIVPPNSGPYRFSPVSYSSKQGNCVLLAGCHGKLPSLRESSGFRVLVIAGALGSYPSPFYVTTRGNAMNAMNATEMLLIRQYIRGLR